MAKYVCTICGYVYDESAGSPDQGIAPGTLWSDLPDDWCCPLCGAPKSAFEAQSPPEPAPAPTKPARAEAEGELRELSYGELAALCSNLSKGCEKQYLQEEAGLFAQLAAYYESRRPKAEARDTRDLLSLVDEDLKSAYPAAKETASSNADRGALRALVWSEKVSRILSSLLGKFERMGGAMLEGTNVFVCEICGFVYVGDEPPEICPICKVPSMKIQKIAKEAV
ncbi:MAG: rubredoxin [Clostridiales bacterium]|nr:rubredoxin [Clostridiales bacterium]